MKKFERVLLEGVYDKHIFKVIFMAGGPGSGKSYVADKVVTGLGLKAINSDKFFTRLLHKAGLSQEMPDHEEVQRHAQLVRAKELTNKLTLHALKGRLGLLIDGTGGNYKIIRDQRDMFYVAGYDAYMIFVNTSLETALDRNAKRERQVPEKIVRSSWNLVQGNMGKFQQLFGAKNFHIIDNNDPDEDIFKKASKEIRKLIVKPIMNPTAQRWIKGELKKRVKK